MAYFLESVDRVMKVLDCFTMESPELRLTDLSDRLGIPKAQVLRIVSTLEAGGYLLRDPSSKRYRLGIRLFHLGMIVRCGMDLRRIAHPHLRQLAEATKETSRLIVPDELGPICIDVVESPRGIRVFAQLGARMPWHAGTSPKLLLAYLPDEQRERILARGGFRRYTERTITDPDVLRMTLLEIRRCGYHVGVRDLDEDAIGISAPIFDDRDQIAGAVNVAAPASRTTESETLRFVDLVRTAAADISRQLGHRPHLNEGRDSSTRSE
jgi:IclR family KDG regulon transcriptional repressor